MRNSEIIITGVILTFVLLIGAGLGAGYVSTKLDNHPIDIFMEIAMEGGKTDVSMTHVACGCWTKDRNYTVLMIHTDAPPGSGKTVSVTVTDGTNNMTATVSGDTNTTGMSVNQYVELDVSLEDFDFYYTQTAGGAVTKAWIMITYNYWENV